MSEKPPIGETEPVTLPTYAIVEAEIRDATCEKAPVPGLSPHREFRQGVFQDSPSAPPTIRAGGCRARARGARMAGIPRPPDRRSPTACRSPRSSGTRLHAAQPRLGEWS